MVRAVPARGPGARSAGAPRHRLGARLRPGRGPRLDRHGARGRGRSAPDVGGGTAAPGGGPGHRPRPVRSAPVRPRPGRGAPGHQARERALRSLRRRQARGLRPRQAEWRRRRPAADPHGPGHGHPPLHGARAAGAPPGGGPPRGPLLPRGDLLRDAHGPRARRRRRAALARRRCRRGDRRRGPLGSRAGAWPAAPERRGHRASVEGGPGRRGGASRAGDPRGSRAVQRQRGRRDGGGAPALERPQPASKLRLAGPRRAAGLPSQCHRSAGKSLRGRRHRSGDGAVRPGPQGL